MSKGLQESFRELLGRTSIENELELKYWEGKFRGKIPKSVKHRMEKLKYIISLQYKAMKEQEKIEQQKKESKQDA